MVEPTRQLQNLPPATVHVFLGTSLLASHHLQAFVNALFAYVNACITAEVAEDDSPLAEEAECERLNKAAWEKRGELLAMLGMEEVGQPYSDMWEEARRLRENEGDGEAETNVSTDAE